jgi:hypothetical protein
MKIVVNIFSLETYARFLTFPPNHCTRTDEQILSRNLSTFFVDKVGTGTLLRYKNFYITDRWFFKSLRPVVACDRAQLFCNV